MIGRARVQNLLERKQSAIIIQKYYRRFMAELIALEYAMERDAATRIQSVVRGWSANNRFRTIVFSTIELQRLGRGYLARRELQTQDAAARVIQRAWWDWVDYADHQVAAILIQKLVRGVLARRQFEEMVHHHEASTAIQKIWRGYVQSTMFQISVEFTIAIQKVFRGYTVRKNLPMQHMSRAAIVIQKTWRGFWAQVQFNMDVLDVVAIQTLARARLAKIAVVRRREAIHCLQRTLRVALTRRCLARELAAIKLQSSVRVWRAKQDLALRRVLYLAATSIQSLWRRTRCQRDFVRAIACVSVIQAAFRGHIVKRMFANCVDAVCTIQHCFRSFSYRLLRRKSATCIQSQFRRVRSQGQYRKYQRSAIAIQSLLRGWKSRNAYRVARMAAIRLQACWRRYFAHLNFELDVLEIVISQSLVRRMLAQVEAKKRRDSVQAIQNFARRSLAMTELRLLQTQHEDYIQRTESSICIQRHARRFLARSHLTACITAATKIQSHVRKSALRDHFVFSKQCAVALQAQWRGYKARNDLASFHDAAASIQAAWRGHSEFVGFSILYGSILIVQSVVRRFLATSAASRRQESVLKIQSICRRFLAIKEFQVRHETRRVELLRNHASTVVQALFRGCLVRHDLWWKDSAATLIQAHYRGRIVRVLYELELYDITTVQAVVRRWLARRLADRRSKSIITIQSVLRAWMARHMASQLWFERQKAAAVENAATKCQTAYRGYLVRRNIQIIHVRATLIQKVFRGHYTYIAFQMMVVDVTIVQSQARLWLVKTWLNKANTSVVRLQSLVRRLSATRHASLLREKRAHLERQHLAASNFQRMWRGHLSRKVSSRHSSARKIQKTWRCFTAHVEYLIQQISVIRLQRNIRMMNEVKSYKRTLSGFVKFQAAFRGYSTREYVRFISLSTIVVQAAFRRYVARKAYLQNIRGVTTLQAISRGVRVREEIEFWNFAASEIQRVWRGFTQFCDFFIYVEATVKLQSFFRKSIAMRRYHDLRLAVYVERKYRIHCACSIQQAYRAYALRIRMAASATVIQRQARIYMHVRRITIVDRGLKRLQALWRAKLVRKLRSKKLLSVAARLTIANRRARIDPKLRIGYKTKHALEVLQNSKSLAGIMDAVKSLETSTRLSQLCCVLFTEAHAARILLDLIRSCNRSIPHVELVQCILLTLDNVCQYRTLVPSFADCNSAEIFLDKMQMFRDKDGIFCLSISLLQCVSECNPMVEEFCAMHEHLKRLKALHQLSLRRGAPSNIPTKRTTKTNRMKRRENFDRNVAVKALGVLTEKFEERSLAVLTMDPLPRGHFTFIDTRCEA